MAPQLQSGMSKHACNKTFGGRGFRARALLSTMHTPAAGHVTVSSVVALK